MVAREGAEGRRRVGRPEGREPDLPRRLVGGLIGAIERLHPDCTAFLHSAAAAGAPLVGLCTGAFILHRAGRMAGYRCCVSWFHHDDFLAAFEGLEPVADRIFVVDRERLTCSGRASSAHPRRAPPRPRRRRQGAAHHDHRRRARRRGTPARHSRRLLTRDPLVRKALSLIQQSLDAPPANRNTCGASRRRPPQA
jgi:hypothetical protein